MSTSSGPHIAVVGAGAVGGYLGARLCAAGHQVSFLARGKNLTAIRDNGLRVISGEDVWSVPLVQASDDPGEIGEVDHVLLCVKTHHLPAALTTLAPLLGGETSVVTVQNGVEAPELVAAMIGTRHVLPGLARLVATPLGPGEIKHAGPPAALAFAEWDGSTSDRVRQLRETFGAAGLGAPEPADIWVDLWTKFLLITPIGSLGAAAGGADIGTLRSRPGTRALLLAGMREIYQTARALGVPLPEDTVNQAAAVMDSQAPGATTSLQRDLLAGRPSELDAWTGAAVRLAARAGGDAPVLGTLYELLATRAAQAEAAA